MDPIPRHLADNIGIVRSGHETDSLRSPRVRIASRVNALLHLIRAQIILVVQHDVMCGSNGALQSRVRLQIEVEVEDGGDAPVLDSAGEGVPVAVGIWGGGQETGVVTFATDDDGEFGRISRITWVYSFEGFENLRELVFENFGVVLALMYGCQLIYQNQIMTLYELQRHHHGR